MLPRRPPPGRLPGGSRRRSAAAVLGRASRPGPRTSVWEGFFVAPLPPRGSRSGRQTKVPVAATGGGGAGAPAAGGPAASSPSLPPGLLVLGGRRSGVLRPQGSDLVCVGGRGIIFRGGEAPGRAAQRGRWQRGSVGARSGASASRDPRPPRRGAGAALPGPHRGAPRPRLVRLRAGRPRCLAPAPTCGPGLGAGRGRVLWDRAAVARGPAGSLGAQSWGSGHRGSVGLDGCSRAPGRAGPCACCEFSDRNGVIVEDGEKSVESRQWGGGRWGR